METQQTRLDMKYWTIIIENGALALINQGFHGFSVLFHKPKSSVFHQKR